MKKERRNFSLSRRAIARRNSRKVSNYLKILLHWPNISMPKNHLELLPAKSLNSQINHERNGRIGDHGHSSNHDNIFEEFAADDEAGLCDNEHHEIEDTDDDDVGDDDDNESGGDDECIPQGNEDSMENRQQRIGSCGDRNNSTLFNLPNDFYSKILMIPNRHTSVQHHLLINVASSLKHHWTYESLLTSFRNTNDSYGVSYLPTTKAALWKALGRNDDHVIKYFYCQKCDDFLGEISSITNQLQQECCCKACGPNKSNTHAGYFLYNNIASQLQQLLSIPSVVDALKYRFERQKRHTESLEDVYDGLEYKRLASSKILKDWYNLSLTFNTDGCNISDSSNRSAWPIFAQINELPPHMRKKHMLLVAVYVDLKHPLMNNYLRPFIDEMRQLNKNGFTWKLSSTVEITSRVIVTMSSLDAPARAAVTNLTQFNGFFSCLHCYVKGKTVKPNKRVFPVEQSFKKLRTNEDLKNDMRKAFQTENSIDGVKGISSLSALPFFDMTKGVIVEEMHAVYLGVVKQHMTLLLTTPRAPYYVGSPSSRRLIDKCLLSIKPPSRRSRKPRSIATYKQWKASEWRNWLDYAPICLEHVLDVKYVNHIALLSEAIFYLNNDSITVSELNRAEELLKKYVQLYQKYFGVNTMTFNIHSLTHLVQTVRNWGPIWGHSAFIFEAWNKKLVDNLTSPHCPAEQIVTRFLMEKFIIASAHDDSVAIETRNSIRKLINIPENCDAIDVRPKIWGQGKSLTRLPTAAETYALASAGYHPNNLICYKKMTFMKVKYCCHAEEKNLKSCDSIINDGSGTYGIIQEIIKFKHGNIIVNGLLMLTYLREGFAFRTRHISRVKLSENLIFVPENSPIKPACLMKSATASYIVTLANCWETD